LVHRPAPPCRWLLRFAPQMSRRLITELKNDFAAAFALRRVDHQ
jgi:hypothetical protein